MRIESPTIRSTRSLRAPSLVLALAVGTFAMGMACSRSPSTSSAPPTAPAVASEPKAAFGGLPVAFEKNVGQSDDEVAFLSRGGSSTVFLTKHNEAVFVMTKPAPVRSALRGAKAKTAPSHQATSTVRMKLVNGNPAAVAVGESELEGRASYLVGKDFTKHHTDVPRFGGVRVREAYPGIDVVYYGGKEHALEYDFVVKEGADPRAIALSFAGAEHVTKASDGSLEIVVGTDTIVLKAPVSHQTIGGVRRDVASRYELDGATARIVVGLYDHAHELVIDPLINFSSYLGGAGAERITCLTRDGMGNIYLSGSTTSADFPKKGAIAGQDTLRGGRDAFVTKLNPTATQVLYSTYLGGTGDEAMTDGFAGFETGAMRTCAVDAQGRVYASTTTFSTDFPTTAGVLSTTLAGGLDVTLSRLNAAGNGLEYSTYIGGASAEYWAVIALEPSGHVWISGQTTSDDFPTKSATQPLRGGVAADADTFVARVTPDGKATTFSTYLGGATSEYPFDIALDAAGNPVIVGATSSLAFPTTAGVVQPVYGGGVTAGFPEGDGFVTKFNVAANGTATIAFSTYLGGSGLEIAQAVALGNDGSIYVGGVTTSPNFPGQVGRPGSATENFDGFVIKLNSTASTRVYSRLFGEDAQDGVYDVAVNAAGNLFVAGTGALGNTTVNGCGRPGDKGILGMLKTDGSGWEYLTPFGTINSQVIIDGADTAYVAGWGPTGSVPIVGSVAQPTFGGGPTDGYLMKLAKLPNATSTGCAPCTGDFGGMGPSACPSNLPKCSASGECVSTGACAVDGDCGGILSGRVCEAKACTDGCRAAPGNGCPPGLVCSSVTEAVGTCKAPPPDAGAVDAGRDAAPPVVADAAVADAAVPPVSTLEPRNDDGSLEGGGLSCSSTPAGESKSGEGAALAFVVVGATLARWRRRR